jgi:hypothetical protein
MHSIARAPVAAVTQRPLFRGFLFAAETFAVMVVVTVVVKKSAAVSNEVGLVPIFCL